MAAEARCTSSSAGESVFVVAVVDDDDVDDGEALLVTGWEPVAVLSARRAPMRV